MKGLPIEPQRILLIRRDNIGDLVCTTPAIAALRKHYPRAEIGALVNSYNSEVLKGNPHLDKVFVYQKIKHTKGWLGRVEALGKRFRLILKLRKWNPDVTILAKSSFDRHGLNLARQIGAKNIIGFLPAPNSTVGASDLPDIRLQTPNFGEFHEVEAISKLLVPLGVEDALGPMNVFPMPSTKLAMNARIPAADFSIALHISAREDERRWGINNYISLTKQILECFPKANVVLLWSPGKANDVFHPGDDEDAFRLTKAINNSRLIPISTSSVSELVAALSVCEVFIGTDGGAMHLAAGLNKKIVALFELQDSKLNHWYPWKVKNRVITSSKEDLPNVSVIEVEQVLSALHVLLLDNS